MASPRPTGPPPTMMISASCPLGQFIAVLVFCVRLASDSLSRSSGAKTGGESNSKLGGTMAQASGVIDVVGFIDEQPVGRFQIQLLLTCAAVLFLDGFDTQAIGYVAPDLARDWGLARGALGPVFSAGLFGLMIGALIFGPLADRIGRKKIIVFSTAAFGIGTLATVFAQDISS